MSEQRQLVETARAVAAASPDEVDRATVVALRELARWVGANGAHVVIDGAVHHHAHAPAAVGEGPSANVAAHHVVHAECIVTLFANRPEWRALVERQAPHVLVPEDVVEFPALRDRMERGALSGMLIVPLWSAGRFAGYFVFLADDHRFSLAPDQAALLYALCDVVGQALLLRSLHHADARSATRYEQLLEMSSDCLFSLDASGALLYLSSSWPRLTGRDLDASLGRSLLEFVHHGDRARVSEALAEASVEPHRVHPVRLLAAGGRTRVSEVWVYGRRPGVTAVGASGLVRVDESVDASAFDPGSALDLLSRRELQIVDGLRRGRRVRGIAADLYLSEHTVRNHLKRIFRKVGVSSQAELVELVAPRHG